MNLSDKQIESLLAELREIGFIDMPTIQTKSFNALADRVVQDLDEARKRLAALDAKLGERIVGVAANCIHAAREAYHEAQKSGCDSHGAWESALDAMNEYRAYLSGEEEQ